MNHGIQIKQSELQEIFDTERGIAEMQKRVEDLKSNVKALLMAKMPIEMGRYYARLIWKTVHHVPWKQVVIDNLGWDRAENYRKSAPSSRLCELMVEEHAIPPLWKGTAGAAEEEQ